MAINTFSSSSKSNRLLQSLRYTMAATDNTEAFTSVLDLNASEVYTQQQYIPSSSLPYSGSSQHLQYVTASIDGVDVNILQYYYRVTMSRSDVTLDSSGKSEAWLAISGSGYDPVATNAAGGVNTQTISPFQLTDWISNKYASASISTNAAEAATPGYGVQVFSAGASKTSGYQFDYKTGVLQWVNNSVAPSTSDIVTVTGYRYVGKTLADEEFGTAGAAGIFSATGSIQATTNDLEITGSLLASGSNIDFSGASSITGSIISASNITSTTFTGGTATFNSASVDHLVVNTIISGSTIETSGSNTFGDETSDVQTLIGTTKMTGSAQVTGSLNVDGVFTLPGIADVSASIAAISGSASSGTNGIFGQIGSTDAFAATSSLQITGSTLLKTPVASGNPVSNNDGTSGSPSKYAMVVSESVWHYNHNVGVPKSKAWGTDLDGSYFNNFNHNTDTSEILRFIAGLLKDQAPDVQRNARPFVGINTDSNLSHGTTTPPSGRIPTGSDNSNFLYLKSKGFATEGQRLFAGTSPQSSTSGYGFNFKSNASGTTAVTSSNTNASQLADLGRIGDIFAVSSSATWKYSDSNDRSGMNSDTSSSLNILATGSGLPTPVSEFTYNIIPTGNDLITPVFQDGLFEGAFPVRIKDPSDTSATGFPSNFTQVQATGYYQVTSSITIQSGSATPQATATFDNEFEVLYSPMASINSSFSSVALTYDTKLSASISATSRSLSRAPYLKTANWHSSIVSNNVFDPLYRATSNIVSTSDNGVAVTVSDGGTGKKSLNLTTGTTSTIATGFDDVVFDDTLSTGRAAGATPDRTDKVRTTSSIAFAPSISQTNIQESSTLGSNIFTLTTTGVNENGSSNTGTQGFAYHVAGTFGQNADSGSLAYYGGSESDDGSSNANGTEDFKSDVYRKEVNNNLLTVTSATAYNVGNAYTVAPLADIDLQVKPGFLVEPGGSNGYWIPANAGDGGDCRFYARTFNATGTTFPVKSLTISFSGVQANDFVDWTTNTPNKISVLIFNQGQTTPIKMVDINDYDNIGNPGIQTASTARTNPFGVNINVLSNNLTSDPGTAPTFKVQTNLNGFLDLTSSAPNFGLLIRYNGDCDPITGITVSYSTS